MKNHALRTKCDLLFPRGSCLRSLASKINVIDWNAAKTNGLLSASPAPFNFLANGETGSSWTTPDKIFAADLVSWKKGANGFAGSTERGLSLIFDPFVDACLLSVSVDGSHGEGTFPVQTKVLVLTDYYPLKHVIGEMSVLAGQDWAAVETEKFQNARNLGLTGNNLFKALFVSQGSIEDVRELGKAAIAKKFADARLLIWNYFPFLRGGSDCEGMSGLPDDCKCFGLCDQLLLRFLESVNSASDVLFAVNQDIKDARSACFVGSPSIFDQTEKFKLVPVDHPGSWRGTARLKEHGATLREYLGK